MKTTISLSTPAELETESLVAVVLDHAEAVPNEKDKKTELKVATTDAAVQAAAAELLASGEVAGKSCETNLLHKPAALKAKRLLLISGGSAKKFSSYDLRRLAGAAVRTLKSRGIRGFAFVAPPGIPAEEAVRAIVEGAHVGNFDPDYYRSDRKDQKIDALTIVVGGDKSTLEKAANEAQIIGESQNFTRDLVNEPSNRMTPTILGERAKKMSTEVGLKCEVYGADKIKELKMGAFWSVAQGSDEPPALIVMKYEPAGAPEKPVLGLVGKGITFDTGGISIKPADGMEKMKYDMAGGATMIGAMRAIALLKPKVKVIGIVCATENMPSGKAQKPGDVQIAMSGKSIEIINTDAEGRLVLADGLFYATTVGLHASGGRRHADRRRCGRAGLQQRRNLCQRRQYVRAIPQRQREGWREDVAHAARRRIQRADSQFNRRHCQLRRTLGRRHHGGHVPKRICGGNTMDSPRHRGHSVDGRTKTMDRERPVRHCAAEPCRVRQGIRGVERAAPPIARYSRIILDD